MSMTYTNGLAATTGSQNDPPPGKRETGGRPLFPRIVSLFSLCYLLLEKLS
jgi:hypothetical protein